MLRCSLNTRIGKGFRANQWVGIKLSWDFWNCKRNPTRKPNGAASHYTSLLFDTHWYCWPLRCEVGTGHCTIRIERCDGRGLLWCATSQWMSMLQKNVLRVLSLFLLAFKQRAAVSAKSSASFMYFPVHPSTPDSLTVCAIIAGVFQAKCFRIGFIVVQAIPANKLRRIRRFFPMEHQNRVAHDTSKWTEIFLNFCGI